MLGIGEWTRDLLLSRGALVETQEGEALRALLPQDLAKALGSGEWLSLDFGGAAADDPGEWLDRLGGLLPATGLATTRLRTAPPAPPVDSAAILTGGLAIQNGVCRPVEDSSAVARYLLLTFLYTIESDERSMGFVTVGLNSTAGSVVSQPERLFSLVRDDLEEDPTFRFPAEELARMYPAAARAAHVQLRGPADSFENSANRRLARDAERVESYYRGLLEQIRKRIARRAADPEAAEKERSRARATESDLRAKLEDLRLKYSLRVRIETWGLLGASLPVRALTVRLIRKKEERLRVLHWNPLLRRLEPVLCEHCCGTAYPLYLCEKIHCLCAECWAACPGCGRFFCPACQPRCKCGAGRKSPAG